VVQAPTGSGKTYIFELLYPNLKTQAVFTVPTRALVLDKHSNRYGSRHGCLYRKAVASVQMLFRSATMKVTGVRFLLAR
jgi:replicative superfamily II helicase